MIRITNIVCPVDFFPASLRAFDYALKFARDNGGKVYALHVVSAGIPAAYDFPIDTSRLTETLEKESKRHMVKLQQKAEKAGVKIQTAVRIGVIDSEILSAIEKAKADLVVGTHGRRGIERWFVGSVAERMMRRCPAPLLTIPPQAVPKKKAAPRKGGA